MCQSAQPHAQPDEPMVPWTKPNKGPLADPRIQRALAHTWLRVARTSNISRRLVQIMWYIWYKSCAFGTPLLS